MSKSSIKYIDKSYLYRNKQNIRAIDNPVIYAQFPNHAHKKSAAEQINKFLNVVLLCLVIVSLISYYFVSDSEKTMNLIGHEIVTLSNENIELQNKLDNLNSFQKIDSVINSSKSLDTARMVMEIPMVNTSSIPKVPTAPVNYKWSIGY